MNPKAKEMEPHNTPQAKDWDSFWKRDQSKQFGRISWSKRRILRVLEPYCTDGKAALDAGCGSGFFSKYFCERKMQTVSFDYSQGALDMAQKTTDGRSTLVKGDLLEDSLAQIMPSKFDVIFTDGLFEHFSNECQDRIMQNLKSVLNADGVIVTFVPNRFSPWEWIRPLYMPGIDEKPFVLTQLVGLNRRNGLRVTQSGGVNTLPVGLSPEGPVAAVFGMLLFTVAQHELTQ